MNRRRHSARPARAAGDLVGASWEVTVGPVAHGGHCVARHEGRVVFVRHVLPGERVLAAVTRGSSTDRFVFADAVEVVQASPHRVPAPCRHAGPGGCGGCDFQHVDLDYQRELKSGVIEESLQRLAGVARRVPVRPVPGDEDGLRWRTRVEFAVGRDGRAGLHPHRSRAVVPVEDCLIARREVIDTGVLRRRWPRSTSVDVVTPSVGEPVVVAVPGGLRSTPDVVEHVEAPGFEADVRLNARGFWQVHPGAAGTFVGYVLGAVQPRPGERCLDLYAGVGLFARALAEAVGPQGAVLAVESDARAVAAGQRDCGGVEQLEFRPERVDAALAPLLEGGDEVDIVVLDPPRSGAGPAVMRDILALRPRVVAYVACDPAALARDLGEAVRGGYRVDDVVGFDAFPMTHHVESIAILRQADADAPDGAGSFR